MAPSSSFSSEDFNREPALTVEGPDGIVHDAWTITSQSIIQSTERVLAKLPAEDGSFAADMSAGHLLSGFVPELLSIPHESNDDTDLESSVSGDFSILSSPTSAAGSGKTIFEFACIALVKSLVTDDNLRPLCSSAHERMSGHDFQVKYISLLHQYGRDLAAESRSSLERRTAKFIRRRACCPAGRAIRRQFFPQSESDLHHYLKLPIEEALLEEDFFSSNCSHDPVSEDSNSDGDVRLPSAAERLNSTKDFLLGSRAFSQLVAALRHFLASEGEEDIAEIDTPVLETSDDIDVALQRRTQQDNILLGRAYLTRAATIPLQYISLGTFYGLFWRFYLFCVHFLLSLVPTAAANKYTQDVSYPPPTPLFTIASNHYQQPL